jgi:hypothetical protein
MQLSKTRYEQAVGRVADTFRSFLEARGRAA